MKALSTGGMGDEYAPLVVIYKGLNYNNRDNDEVKLLRGIRGAADAAEVFGPNGVWVYNLLLNFLEFPAGTVSLKELLDSAIQRRNAPSDKMRCLSEIEQFWKKLENKDYISKPEAKEPSKEINIQVDNYTAREKPADRLKAKLKKEYSKKSTLPKLFEEDSIEQEIESTYVNLMLIEREKEKDKSDTRKEEKGGENAKEIKIYGSYEEISAPKREIEIEAIFDKQKAEVNKVLIYGRAGIGKTTLCNYISYKWSQGKLWKDKFDYVFWLPLRELSGDWHNQYKRTELRDYPVECFIKRHCLDRDRDFGVTDIAEVIEKGRVLLILDGYDEIASFHNEKHTVVKDVIDSVIGIENAKAKVIMTSRPNAVSQSIRGKFDAEIENAGLKIDNVYEYVDKYKFKEEGKAGSLKALLKQHGQIESIAQVPINLYLLCLIWDKEGLKSQENITVTALYEEVVEWLMKRYLSKFKEKKLVEISYNGIEEGCAEEGMLLEKIAYCGVQKKTAILRSEECKGSGVDWNKLSTLKALGILSGKGVEEATKEYEFIHLTFQEYFAARHIVRLLGSKSLEEVKEVVKFLSQNKYTRVHERVILFVSGLVTLELEKKEKKEALLNFWNVILNGNVDLGAGRQLSLIIRCLEEGGCNKEIPGINKLLGTISQYNAKGLSKFGYFEQSLRMSIQVMRESGIIEGFIKRLKSLDKQERNAALAPLGELKLEDVKLMEAATKALIEALKGTEENVRRGAASALGGLKLEDVKLIEAVTNALIEALKDPKHEVCSAAAEALGKLKLEDVRLREKVVKVLVEAFKDPEDLFIIVVLGKLELADVKLKGEVAKALIEKLKDPEEIVRGCAAGVIGLLKLEDVKLIEEVAKALIEALKDPDKEVRGAAAGALRELKLENVKLIGEVVEALIKVLKDPEDRVRSAAIEVLGKLKLEGMKLIEKVVKALMEALKDPEDQVRMDAAEALGRLKLEDVRLIEVVAKALVEVLKDPEWYVRDKAEAALGKLKLEDKKLIEMLAKSLIEVFKDPDKDVREVAARALVGLKLEDVKLTEVVVKVLVEALKGPEEGVRRVAALVLGELKLEDVKLIEVAAKSLIEAFKDPDKEVRRVAALALRELKLEDVKLREEGVKALIEVLKDLESDVRCTTAEVLGKLKLEDIKLIEEVVRALIEVLNGPDDLSVRMDAAMAIGGLKLEDVKLIEKGVKALVEALKGPEQYTCSIAALALRKLKLEDVKLIEVVTKALIEALNRPEKVVRWCAASALGRLKIDDVALIKEVVEALIKALKDSKKDVRKHAVEALKELKPESMELKEEIAKALIEAFKDPDKEVRGAAALALRKLKLEDVRLIKEVAKALIENPDKDVCSAAAEALGELKLEDEELRELVVKTLIGVLKEQNEWVRKAAVEALGRLKLEDEELERKIATELLKANEISLLGKLQITSKGTQKEIAESLIEGLPSKASYDYYHNLNKALEKCAINGIKLSPKIHIMKLLERLSDVKIFQKSAVVISNSHLTLYYGDHHLIFKFDSKDKKLPLKVWQYFRDNAEEGLPTELLDSVRYGRKWIEVEGIHPEVDKVIRNNITGGLEMREIIARELELDLGISAQDKDGCVGDLLQVCMGIKNQAWLVGKYQGQKQSPILVVALQFAVPGAGDATKIGPEHIKTIRNVITELVRQGIGMRFKDRQGNTVGHYAVKHWYRGLDRLILQDGLYITPNNNGAMIVHTAVFYGCVEGVYNSIGKQNLNFSQKVQIGNWQLTALELAVALGDVDTIRRISAITGKMPKTDLLGGNILSLAMEFGRYEVLHHLLYGYNMDSGLVQEAFVFASVVGNKGSIEALRMIKGSFKRYDTCSVDGHNSSGNTALHEVVGKEGMKRRDKQPIIYYLWSQDEGLLDKFNSAVDKKLPRDMTANVKLKGYLDGLKGQKDDKRYKVPGIWETPIKNIVFKGGGPKGVVYVGAMKEFEKIQRERGFEEVERVAGTSAGAITAGLYAIGYTAEELERDVAAISLISLLDSENIKSVIEIEKKHKSMQGKMDQLMSQKGVEGGKLIFEIISTLGNKGGLCSGNNFERIFEDLICKKTGKQNFTLGDLKKRVQTGEAGYKELSVVTLNIDDSQKSLVVLSTDNKLHKNIRLVDAIRASMSIPIVYEPKRIEYYGEDGSKIELRCVDGGMVYNYPVDIFDKVKYQHGGIDAIVSEKPEYNPYTLGFSICSSKVNASVVQVGANAEETIKMKLIKACHGLSIWLAGGNPMEVAKDIGNMVTQIKPIIEVLKNGEMVRNEYWEVSDDKRTIEIDALGVGLLDFDISADKIVKLMKSGEKAVKEGFNEDLQEAKMRSAANITRPAARSQNPNASTSLSSGRPVKVVGTQVQANIPQVQQPQPQNNQGIECLLM